jgi:hypothetical protein
MTAIFSSQDWTTDLPTSSPIIDYGEGDVPLEKFVPRGPHCRISHYELHCRNVDGILTDTVELVKGCGDCGQPHNPGDCQRLLSWPNRPCQFCKSKDHATGQHHTFSREHEKTNLSKIIGLSRTREEFVISLRAKA